MKPHFNLSAAARCLCRHWVTSRTAGGYTFTKIADTDGDFSRFGFVPAINNRGTVAFRAALKTGGEGIFIGDGDTPIKIADTRSSFRGLASPAINDAGTVAFLASLKTGGEGIFTGDVQGHDAVAIASSSTALRAIAPACRSRIVKIADTSGPLSGFNGIPSINNQGTVAFWAALEGEGEGILIGNGNMTTIIADTSGTFCHLASPRINNIGTVAFRAIHQTGGESIFTSNRYTLTQIANSRDFLKGFTCLSINDSDTLVFLAYREATEESIVMGNHRKLIPIAKSSSLLSGFANPAINNEGMVAFWASLKAGGEGIFTGTHLKADKVIATGDFLDGNPVVSLVLSPAGLNNAGQIVFYASLANGTSGVFRAEPKVLSLKTVSEPDFLLSLPTLSTSGTVATPTQKQGRLLKL